MQWIETAVPVVLFVLLFGSFFAGWFCCWQLRNKVIEIVMYEKEWRRWVIDMFKRCGCAQDPEDPPPIAPDWP